MRKYYKTDILMAAIFNLCIKQIPQGWQTVTRLKYDLYGPFYQNQS